MKDPAPAFASSGLQPSVLQAQVLTVATVLQPTADAPKSIVYAPAAAPHELRAVPAVVITTHLSPVAQSVALPVVPDPWKHFRDEAENKRKHNEISELLYTLFFNKII